MPSPLGSATSSATAAAANDNLSKCRDGVPRVANGRMACDPLPVAGSPGGLGGVRCTPVCDPDHRFYQKFTSRPPTYICNAHRVDWEIRRFVPDCSPVYSAVHNRECLAGVYYYCTYIQYSSKSISC